METRRRFLTAASTVAATVTALFTGRSALGQGSGAPKVGYVRPGGTGAWEVNKKHSNRGKTPQSVHARIEATESGQSGSIVGIVFDPSSTFTPAAASVFWSGDHKIPHASLCMTVPPGASFQIKLSGDIPKSNVHLSVFQEAV